ncbi:hypothetical protein B0H13DRAFT_2523450 [Mycena leptocephala]|nr:hypothetical protein B0H13DRAFT_2523450 [Mycena leptocephala]
MPLKLYGFTLSSCTRRVAVVYKELDVPYELVSVDILKGEQRSTEHLARGAPSSLILPISRPQPSSSRPCTPTIAKFSVTGRSTLNVNFGVQQKLVRKAFSYF